MKMFNAHNGNLRLNEDALDEAVEEYFWGVSATPEETEAAHAVIGRAIVAYLSRSAHYAVEGMNMLAEDAVRSEKNAKREAEAARKSHNEFLDFLWERLVQFQQADARYARLDLSQTLTEIHNELRLLRAMQAQWDTFTKAQLDNTFTELFLSGKQAESGQTITFDQLKERLANA